MKIFVSIVSHGNQAEISESNLIEKLEGLEVIVRENIPNTKLQMSGVHSYYNNLNICGFGANHNKSFEVVAPNSNDWFIICNPDILVSTDVVLEIVKRAISDNEDIAVPFLYNGKTRQFDHNVRRFPTVLTQARSLFGMTDPSRYTKDEIENLNYPDFASGAFIAVKASKFLQLNGFDEDFFMYLEDADLCRRATNAGSRIRFYSDITVTHNAARSSRKIFSELFFHHIKSSIKFSIKGLR